MKAPQLIETKTSLPTAQIELGRRLRPVSAAGVATIVASVREIGQIANPIVVRQLRRKGETVWVVLDGAHRLAAASELGWDEVPVRVFECTDDQARLLEIDGNLAGAELNPLDTAVFLANRKAVYEKLHPEAAHRVFRGNQHEDVVTDIESFTTVTAEKFGMTPRHVRRLIAAGSKLGPDEIARLRAAPRQVTLKDLQDIAGIGAAPQRYEVVKALAEGQAKNAASALKALQAPVEVPEKDPVEAQFVALKTAWKRAGAQARRRFADECGVDLLKLLGLQLGVELPRLEAAE